jgi:hypothetical protein
MENKKSPPQAAGIEDFSLKSLRIAGEQIPRTPSFNRPLGYT